MSVPCNTQPDRWWFSIFNSQVHLMSTEIPIPLYVIDVDPAGDSEENVIVKCTNQSFTLQIGRYRAVDKTFLPLEQSSSRQRFLAHFESISKATLPPEEYIIYVDPQTQPAQEVQTDGCRSSAEETEVSEVPYDGRRSFQEEVELMRRLHPERYSKSSDDFLDSANRKWRQECTKLLNCVDRATFGGRFKESIYCSCLPACCFEQLQHVFQAFNNGTLESTKPLKTIKPGLFTNLVGVKEEMVVHRMLSRLSAGLLTVEDFRKETKALKDNKESRSKSTEEELLEENSRLRREIESIKRENLDLKRKIRNQDVFEFIDIDDVTEKPDHSTQIRVTADLHTQPSKRICERDEREKQFNSLIKEMRQENRPTEQQEPTEQDQQPTQDIDDIVPQEDQQPTQDMADIVPQETTDVTYSKGEKVMAEWDKKWYRAVIVRVNKTKGYYIRYCDGITATVEKDRLRKL